MAVVGIDLGTTFCVVATPQSFDGKFFQRIRGITLIKDKYNQRLTPSVVALSGQGELLVGRRAKNRAGLTPQPIMFIKRHMGESARTAMGERDLLPEEVSAEILRYLKAMAEEQMGEPVEEAVITVPAYFSKLQKQKTKEAGELAGLEVGDILQEPVAAALTYFHEDKRDPLTIMTYDLGGGTFDVAVLRKEGGVLSVLAFDGDRHLGGCDFDKHLAFWILDQLNKGMYELEAPEDSPTFTKLLTYAERAKIQLTNSESYELVEQSTGIVDKNGEPVSIELEVPREVLEQHLQEHIDETVRLCRRALDKADPPIPLEQVEEIVLVGGSSRIPMVSRKLEEAFGKKPQLMEPDLCVAMGAAMIARRLGRRIGPLKLGQVPESTNLSSIQVTGQVRQTKQVPDPSSCTVILSPADGSMPMRQPVSNGGGFLFPQVPLAPDTTNRFVLRLEDSRGQEVLSHPFAVVREAAGATFETHAGLPTNVLAKPISIMTVTGLAVVAKERTALPHDCHTSAQTTDQEGTVQIPIYEDNSMIGEIRVTGVPQDLPVGTRVDIDLTFGADFSVEGVARIEAAGVQGKAAITLPPIEVKSLGQLQDEHLALSRQASEALAQADAGQAFAIAPRLNAALAACQKELFERSPNLARAQELLGEVETLVAQLGTWNPDPPQEKYDALRREVEQRLPALQNVDAGAEGRLQGNLKAVTNMADTALANKDDAAWRDAYVRLQELKRDVGQAQAAATPGGGEQDNDPRSIKMKLSMMLTDLKKEARETKKDREYEAEFTRCSTTLKDIDPGHSDAMQKLGYFYEHEYQPLEARVTGISTPPTDPKAGLVILDPGKPGA